MRYLILLILVLVLATVSYSQSPEYGIFYSMEHKESLYDTVTDDYVDMGFTASLDGKYAFEFNKGGIVMHLDGKLLGKYKIKRFYTVSERYKIEETENYTEFKYISKGADDESVVFVVRVIDSGAYNTAIVFMWENSKKGVFQKRNTYICVRE